MHPPIYRDEEEEWNRALLLYNAVLKEICTKLEILNNEFKLAHQYNPIEHSSSRIKTPESIARKMRMNNRELTVENVIRYVNMYNMATNHIKNGNYPVEVHKYNCFQTGIRRNMFGLLGYNGIAFRQEGDN